MAYPRLHVAAGKITAAQINAGYNVVLNDTTRMLRVTDCHLRAIGGNANATTITLKTTASSPVLIYTWALAGLTENAVVRAGAANSTIGVGFNAELTTGGALQLKASAAESSASDYEYVIFYRVT